MIMNSSFAIRCFAMGLYVGLAANTSVAAHTFRVPRCVSENIVYVVIVARIWIRGARMPKIGCFDYNPIAAVHIVAFHTSHCVSHTVALPQHTELVCVYYRHYSYDRVHCVDGNLRVSLIGVFVFASVVIHRLFTTTIVCVVSVTRLCLVVVNI